MKNTKMIPPPMVIPPIAKYTNSAQIDDPGPISIMLFSLYYLRGLPMLVMLAPLLLLIDFTLACLRYGQVIP